MNLTTKTTTTTTTIFIFLLLSLLHNSFEIEIFDRRHALHFTHTIGSNFGQSISLYSQNIGTGQLENVVLAGAPLESIPGAEIVQTGNTLKCPIDLNSQNTSVCKGLDLSGILTKNEENTMGDVTNLLEEKKGMLMGSSLYSSPESGQIITCGPLYKAVTVDYIEHPIGLCHVLRDLTATSEIVSPCRKEDCSQLAGIPRLHYGYCMAGFSATFFSLGEEVMLGGPGRGYFQGAGFKGREADCSMQTTPMDALPSFGFAGYSVTTGRVFNRNEETIILSAPRANLFGEILTYSNSTVQTYQSLSRVSSLRGSYGGYLGYSVLAVDIDGDGLEEILASEPLYSDLGLRIIEIGRVVVIGVNNVTNQLEVLFNFTAPTPVSFSRFGTAISLIGDLDEDGFPEIAISAPFTSNGGTVFIYRATKDGFNTVPIQILLASNYMPIGAKLESFGFSLASRADIDNNGYEDLLIGAPLSDRVVLVRSHRLVRINANFSSTVSVVNIKSADKCDVVVNGVTNSFGCFQVTYNFSFSGWPAPEWIILDTNISVDISRFRENLDTRGFFVMEEAQVESVRETMNISVGEIRAVEKRVYLSQTIFQLATPLEFLAEFQIIDTKQRDYFATAVVIEPQSMESYGGVQLININCGTDNRCDPNLELTAYYSFIPDKITNQIPESLTPGKSQDFTIHLEVTNLGEEASRPRIQFNHSQEISYRNTLASVITDNHISDTGLILSLGNSINQDERYEIVVVFTTTRNIPDQDFVTMEIEFYSENVLGDSDSASSQYTLNIPVRTEVNIISNAINYKDTTHKTENLYIPKADNSNQDVDIVGLGTVHQYTVRNLGPWSGNSSFSLTLSIYWPIGNLLTNEFYLYLTRIQATEAVCEQIYVNKLNFYIPNSSNRRRRDSVSDSISEVIRRARETFQTPDPSEDIVVDCRENSEYCVRIQCFLNPLGVGQTASVVISSNLYEPTLTKLSRYGVWNLTSYAILNVTSGADITSVTQDNAFVTTIARLETGAGPDTNAPAWYIYVIPTVVLVVMVILLAIVILYAVEYLRAKKKKREHRPLHEPTQHESDPPVGGEENETI